jgi:hypothetical protein
VPLLCCIALLSFFLPVLEGQVVFGSAGFQEVLELYDGPFLKFAEENDDPALREDYH